MDALASFGRQALDGNHVAGLWWVTMMFTASTGNILHTSGAMLYHLNTSKTKKNEDGNKYHPKVLLLISPTNLHTACGYIWHRETEDNAICLRSTNNSNATSAVPKGDTRKPRCFYIPILRITSNISIRRKLNIGTQVSSFCAPHEICIETLREHFRPICPNNRS